MEETNKYSLLLKYSPRELEIFNFIKEDLSEKTNVSDNRNEIMRRGLNSFQYIVQGDENLLLNELSINLKLLYENLDWNRFVFVKNLALLSYTIMICKKGISESEFFESIILNMTSIEDYKNENLLNEQTKELINTTLDYMSKSIDLIFLKKNIELPSKLSLEPYYLDKSKISRKLENKDFDEIKSFVYETTKDLMELWSSPSVNL